MDETAVVVRRLTAQAFALAGLAARIRLDELGVSGDTALRAEIDNVVAVLGVTDIDVLTPAVRASLLAAVQTSLRQALDLVEHPESGAAWTHADAELLQAQGRASAGVAGLFLAAGLGRPDARILDIGTGVAHLAIAFLRAYPQATLVGIDPWAPALEIARANVADAGLGARITLCETTVEDLQDEEGFDLVWFPSSFIPEAVIDAALARVHQLTRPQAEVVVALREDDDALVAAAENLKTARSGGAILTTDDAAARLERAGFVDVRPAPVTWKGPMRLVVGHRG